MIWVVGAKGMLGQDLCSLFKEKNIEFISSDIELDITDIKLLEDYIKNKDIDWIINCAAYTAVDRAEDEEDICFKINSLGPENISKLAEKYNIKLIHISTDYVFDGLSDEPYIENDLFNPQSVYGRSKLSGERKIIKNSSKYFILRTAWLYGKNGPNFVKTMLNLMKEKDEIGVVSDQWGCPTWTKDLSDCIYNIVLKNSNKYGIYHASGEGKTTWYDFAEAIQNTAYENNILKRKIIINKLKTNDYPVKAKRPKNSILSKEKLKNELCFYFPDWYDSLKLFIRELSI